MRGRTMLNARISSFVAAIMSPRRPANSWNKSVATLSLNYHGREWTYLIEVYTAGQNDLPPLAH